MTNTSERSIDWLDLFVADSLRSDEGIDEFFQNAVHAKNCGCASYPEDCDKGGFEAVSEGYETDAETFSLAASRLVVARIDSGEFPLMLDDNWVPVKVI